MSNLEVESIFQNKSYWKDFDQNQLNEYVDRIFHHYRSTGFPFYPTDKEYRDKEFQTLMKFDTSSIIKDGVIQQTMHGLGLAWSFFPHAFEVKCGNKMSPLEAFNDDSIFMKVIEKRLKIGTYVTDAGILKMLKLYSSVQAVSNFRPTAAAAIYQRYAPNGIVWDMSGGWGGRMLGAVKAGVKFYYATDPSEKTYDGLLELKSFLSKKTDTKILVEKIGSEDFVPLKGMVDLCFTSPPYFDLEKYADEYTQSYVRFDNKELWVEGFLRKTFENCYYGLKPGGIMAINIADPKKKNSLCLENETVRVAEETGFKLTETLKLALLKSCHEEQNFGI
jgi:hypothetical protein